jgi:hypothetical protein
MFKQIGISSIELLLSLTIISSVTAFTLNLSEEVEVGIEQYQEQTNVKDLLKKIRSKNTSDQLEN